jgi:hypothetical protein
MTRRDNKDATWCSLGKLCRDCDWSRPRAIYELQNGLRFRTVPPGYEHKIDWEDRRLHLNLETSEVSSEFLSPICTVGIEVLPPSDETDDAASRAPDLPTPPAAKNVSTAALRDCLLAIMDEHPDDPPGDDALVAEIETRLDASVARDRVRDVRREYAPHWVLPRGRPRKSPQD